MKASLSTACAALVVLGACGRAPQANQQSARPLSQREEKAKEPAADPNEPPAKELTDSEIRRRVLMESAGGMRHIWLSEIASLKRQLFGSFFLALGCARVHTKSVRHRESFQSPVSASRLCKSRSGKPPCATSSPSGKNSARGAIYLEMPAPPEPETTAPARPTRRDTAIRMLAPEPGS